MSDPDIRSFGPSGTWVALTPGHAVPDHPVRCGLTMVNGSAVPPFDLPPVRQRIVAGTVCGHVGPERLPVYAPVSGTVTIHNPELKSDPALLQRDPMGSGWLFAVLVDPTTDPGAAFGWTTST